MQEIIRAYGKFLFSAVTVALLLSLLFGTITDENGNRGIFNIVGAYLDIGAQEKWSYQEFLTLQTENVKPAPEIYFDGSGGFETGSILLTQYLTAVDYLGNPLAVKVLRVQNPSGQDIIENYQADSGWLSLPVEGIYTIEVSATDSCNKRTVTQVRIPVNK